MKILAIEMLNNGYCKDINGNICKNIDEVIEINLYNKELTEVPSDLKLFKNLKILELGNNNIKIIENLENCINLENLNLGFNKISKIKGLGNNKKLKKLYLHSNQINNIEELSLKNQHNLEYLNIKNNNIVNLNGLERNKKLKDFYFDEELLKNLDNESIENFFKENKNFNQSTYLNVIAKIINFKIKELSKIKYFLFDFVDFNKIEKEKIPYIIELMERDFIIKSTNDEDYSEKFAKHLNDYLITFNDKNSKENNEKIENFSSIVKNNLELN